METPLDETTAEARIAAIKEVVTKSRAIGQKYSDNLITRLSTGARLDCNDITRLTSLAATQNTVTDTEAVLKSYDAGNANAVEVVQLIITMLTSEVLSAVRGNPAGKSSASLRDAEQESRASLLAAASGRFY